MNNFFPTVIIHLKLGTTQENIIVAEIKWSAISIFTLITLWTARFWEGRFQFWSKPPFCVLRQISYRGRMCSLLLFTNVSLSWKINRLGIDVNGFFGAHSRVFYAISIVAPLVAPIVNTQNGGISGRTLNSWNYKRFNIVLGCCHVKWMYEMTDKYL